jgi:hypothetical protein
VVAQRRHQRLRRVARVQDEEDEVTAVREPAGRVDQVERARVGVAPVRHALHGALDHQHDVDLVLQAADVVLVGPRRELAQAGEVDDAQVAHLRVRERAVDPYVAHREVAAGDRPLSEALGGLLLGVRRVRHPGSQLPERDDALATGEIGRVGRERVLHGAEAVEHRDPARSVRRSILRLGVGPPAELVGRGRQPGDVQLGVVRRDDVGDEGVEGVQPQRGAPQLRRVEDPAADRGDRQRLPRGDLVVTQARHRLQQRRLADPRLPADPDVHRLAGEARLQHPQQPDRLRGALAGVGKRQRERVAQLRGRGDVRPQRLYGCGQRGELLVDRAPAGHLGTDARKQAAAVGEDARDAPRGVGGIEVRVVRGAAARADVRGGSGCAGAHPSDRRCAQ